MASRRSPRLHLDGSVRSQAVKLVAQYVGVLSKGADSDPHLDEFMQRAHVADQLIASLSAKVDALEESVTGKKGQPKAGQSGAKEEYTSATLKVVHHDESKLTLPSVQLAERKQPVIQNVGGVIRFIARLNGRGDLVGDEDAADLGAQVSEWLQIFDEDVADGCNTGGLEYINQHLTTRSFLCGHGITAADIAVYAGLQPVITDDDVSNYAGLARWFSTVQSAVSDFVADDKLKKLPLPPSPIFSMPIEVGSPSVETKQGGASAASASTSSSGAPTGKPSAEDIKAARAAKKAAKAAKTKAKQQKGKGQNAKATPVGRLDIRVGKIVSVEPHPSDEKLYVEQVDVGGETRTVISGLAGHIPLDTLKGALCCIVVNVADFTKDKVTSKGRILVGTASDGSKKELVTPPPGAKVGETLTFPGVTPTIDQPYVKDKKLRAALKSMKITDKGHAEAGGAAFTTSAGVCTLASLVDGTIA